MRPIGRTTGKRNCRDSGLPHSVQVSVALTYTSIQKCDVPLNVILTAEHVFVMLVAVCSQCHAVFSPIVATGVDKHLQHLLGNEKLNFRVLSEAVHRLGGIPPLMTSSDMSNTLPDEKVSAQSATAPHEVHYGVIKCIALLTERGETGFQQ